METVHQPKIIAHRGASGHERENTVSAFVLAGQGDCYGIETDTHVTLDGQFIIIHDDSTHRVSGVDLPVEKTSFDRLRQVRLFAHGSTAEVSDALQLPTVEEYVNVCQTYGKIGVLELKNEMAPEHIAKLIDCVEKLGFQDRIVYISFYFSNMVTLRNLLPNGHLQYLVGEVKDQDALLAQLAAYRLDLDIYQHSLTEELVEGVHALGQEVNVWTVDAPEMYRKLAGWGVDYITTNFPVEIGNTNLS